MNEITIFLATIAKDTAGLVRYFEPLQSNLIAGHLFASPLPSMLVLAAVGLIICAMFPEINASRKAPQKGAGPSIRLAVLNAFEYAIGFLHALLVDDWSLAFVTGVGALLGWSLVGLILRGRWLGGVGPADHEDGRG